MKKLTQEDLNWLFTSPACRGAGYFNGAHCAKGKMDALEIYFRPDAPGRFHIPLLNDYGDYVDYREWEKNISQFKPTTGFREIIPNSGNHEKAIKLALQYALEDKSIEFEDEAAKEFLNLTKEEVVV